MATLPPEPETMSLEEAEGKLRTLLPSTFPINAQDSFGVFNTFLKLIAQGDVDVRTTISEISKQGFVITATGGYLDAHAEGMGLARIQASKAEHDISFVTTTSTTIPANTIVQTYEDADGTVYRFLVKADTVLPIGGGLVRVIAEQPGSAYNVGEDRIQTLVTLINNVTSITNTSTSLIVAGVDEETDDQLRERLILAWPGRSAGGIWKNYELWTREVPGITKVLVDDQHPRGQGTVDVYIAPASGLPTADQIAQATTLVDDNRPITADVLVKSPTPIATTFNVKIYRKAGSLTTSAEWVARVQAAVDAAEIGQTFYLSRIADALHNYTDEVAGVDVTLPVADITVQASEMVTAQIITVELLWT